HNGDELLGASELLVERLLTGEIAVEGEIGDDGALFDGGAGVVEVEHGRLEAQPSSADVIALGPAKDCACHLCVDDGGLAERIAVGPTEARADGNGRDVDVLAFLQDGGGFLDVCLRKTHARIVLQGEIDGGDEGYLSISRTKRRREREGRYDQERRDSLVPLHFRLRLPPLAILSALRRSVRARLRQAPCVRAHSRKPAAANARVRS